MDQKEKTKKIVKLIFTFVVFIIFLVISMLFHKVFSQEDAQATLVAVANSITVPSVIYFSAGVLSFTAGKGSFDGLAYSVKNFGLHNLIPTKQPKHYETYYDYTERRREKRNKWNSLVFWIGLGGMAVSLLLSVIC